MLLEGNHSLQFNPDFYINMVAYTHGYLSLVVYLSDSQFPNDIILKTKIRRVLEAYALVLSFDNNSSFI